jgi:hypothetical protein
MYLGILITILLVSIDALFVGASLRLQRSFKFYYFFIIFGMILASSVVFFFVAEAIAPYITFDTGILLGVTFTVMGIRAIFEKEEDGPLICISCIVGLGLMMSIDAVVATVALTIEYGNFIWIPVLAAGCHLLFLFVGSLAERFMKVSPKARRGISAGCMFLVAALNFTGVL